MGVCCEGVKGATADIRLFSLSPCRLRRGEIPAQCCQSIQKEYKGTTAQFGGASGDVFSAICIMQISRFTASKPSKFAFASDEKSIRQPTTSFVRCYLNTFIDDSKKINFVSGAPKGSRGRAQTSSVSIAPLSRPQPRNPLLARKTSYVWKTGNPVAPIWRDTA